MSLRNRQADGSFWFNCVRNKRKDIERIVEKLQRESSAESGDSSITMHDTASIRDFDDLGPIVGRLTAQQTQRSASSATDGFWEEISPRVRSFSHLLLLSSHYEPAVSLLWGALLMIIKFSCDSVDFSNKILPELRHIHNALPTLLPTIGEYEVPTAAARKLEAIYQAYLDCCLIILEYMAIYPYVKCFGFFSRSSLRRKLKKAVRELDNDIASLNRAMGSLNGSASSIRQPETGKVSTSTTNVQQSLAPPQTIQDKSINRICNINVDQNVAFLGRETELFKLREILIDQDTTMRPISCSLEGFPGVGKTETALHFARTNKHDFEYVFWVSADPDQPTELLRTFAAIGRQLKLFDTANISDIQVDKVREWLENEDCRWLIVFDNVVNRQSIAHYLPKVSKQASAILITTNRELSFTDKVVEIKPLDTIAGAKFLMALLKRSQIAPENPQWESARKISDELEGSPLYLTHISAWIDISKSTLADALKLIQTSTTPLEGRLRADWRYSKAMFATHDAILRELSGEARNLLFMLALMNPDETREELFESYTFPDLAFLSDRATYTNYVVELAQAKLVGRTREGNRYRLRMHRATQFAMLLKLSNDPTQRDDAFRRVLHLIRDNFPDPSIMSKLLIAEARVWPEIIKVLPHLLATVACFEKLKIQVDVFFAQLLSDIARFDLYDRGWINTAYKINKIIERVLIGLGPDDRNSRLMADALTMIGLCTDFKALSFRQEGLEVRKRCMEFKRSHWESMDHRKISRDDRIWFHNGLTDLSCSWQQVNNFEQIRTTLDKCLNNYTKWGSEDEIPYEYAKYYNQIAYVLLYENRGDEAIESSKKGWELANKASPDTPTVLLFKSDYACILFQHGKQKEARDLLVEILAAYAIECGKQHIRTMEIELNLGIMDYFLQDLQQAEQHIRAALMLEGVDEWPTENVIRSKYYLSQILKSQSSNMDEALQIEAHAVQQLDDLIAKHGIDETCNASRPLQFDYIVHWEWRLVTPQTPPETSTTPIKMDHPAEMPTTKATPSQSNEPIGTEQSKAQPWKQYLAEIEKDAAEYAKTHGTDTDLFKVSEGFNDHSMSGGNVRKL